MDPETRPPLSRSVIVGAAVALADDAGIEAVSMRKVADRLGYKVMSLYNHIANKDELLASMLDSVAAEISVVPVGDGPLAQPRAVAVGTRAAYLRHPWAPAIWQRHVPGPARTDQMEQLLAAFANSGLPPDLAHDGFHAVTNHVLGYTLQMQSLRVDPDEALGAEGEAFLAGLSPGRHPHTIAHLHQHMAGETSNSFELVLDLILDGLVRLADERKLQGP